jgi:effector-binding domain-containing protein
VLSEPKIVERTEQPYLSIKASAPMSDLGEVIQRSFEELYGWMEARGIPDAGPPFIRYDVIDMERRLQIQLCVPVAGGVSGDDRVHADVLPGGRYGSLVYTGDYEGLVGANEALQQWGRDQGLEWDMSETGEGDRFGGRIEVYLKDPGNEPDPAKWETEVAYRLADGS